MEEAERLADRIAVIAAGQIVAEGTPQTLGGRQLEAAQISFRLPGGASAEELPSVLAERVQSDAGRTPAAAEHNGHRRPARAVRLGARPRPRARRPRGQPPNARRRVPATDARPIREPTMFCLTKHLIRMWQARGRPRRVEAGRRPSDLGGQRDTTGGRRASAASRGPLALLAAPGHLRPARSACATRARGSWAFFFPIVLLVVFIGVFGNGTRIVDGHAREPQGLLRARDPGDGDRGQRLREPRDLISGLRETGVLKRRRATPVPRGGADRRPGARDGRDDRRSLPTILLVIAKLALRRWHRRPGDPRDRVHDAGRDARVCLHRLCGLGDDRVAGCRTADRPDDDAAAVVHLRRVHPGRQPQPRAEGRGCGVPGRSTWPTACTSPPSTRSFGSAISVPTCSCSPPGRVGAAAFCAWRFSWLPAGASR